MGGWFEEHRAARVAALDPARQGEELVGANPATFSAGLVERVRGGTSLPLFVRGDGERRARAELVAVVNA